MGIAIGAIFICCSRERQEDEMVQAVRLQALMMSLYVYVGLLIVCTLVINNLYYLYFMIANLCLFPRCIFIGIQDYDCTLQKSIRR